MSTTDRRRRKNTQSRETTSGSFGWRRWDEKRQNGFRQRKQVAKDRRMRSKCAQRCRECGRVNSGAQAPPAIHPDTDLRGARAQGTQLAALEALGRKQHSARTMASVRHAYDARAACPSAFALAKRLSGSSAIAMQITSANGTGTSRASHCSRMSRAQLGFGPRQTKEQQGTERIDIASHARLAKTVLLGWRIGSRAKLNGIGIGSFAPHASDSQVDNHQR